MKRRKFVGRAAVAAGLTSSGCLGILGGKKGVIIKSSSTEAAMGAVWIDAVVENTADSPRRCTVLATFDISGIGKATRREELELASGERQSVSFSVALPHGTTTVSYNWDVRIEAAAEPGTSTGFAGNASRDADES